MRMTKASMLLFSLWRWQDGHYCFFQGLQKLCCLFSPKKIKKGESMTRGHTKGKKLLLHPSPFPSLGETVWSVGQTLSLPTGNILSARSVAGTLAYQIQWHPKPWAACEFSEQLNTWPVCPVEWGVHRVGVGAVPGLRAACGWGEQSPGFLWAGGAWGYQHECNVISHPFSFLHY